MSSLTLFRAQSELDELRATTSPTDISTPSPVVEVAVLSRHLRSALQSVGRGIKRADRLLTTLREEGLLESPPGRTLGAAIQAERARLFAVIVEYAPDEAYYWTTMWQEGEQEIEDECLRGGPITFQDEDALDAALRGR